MTDPKGTRPGYSLRMESRMSDAEALMWAAERDPVLRSSFLNLTLTDRPIDVHRFRERMRTVVDVIPRLRQKVVTGMTGRLPMWVEDDEFDIDRHVLALKVDGLDHRGLLDLAGRMFEDDFDHAHPLWRMLVVDGLAEAGGALVSKLHHTITDGVGGVRLSAMFVDLSADQTEPNLMPSEAESEPGQTGDGLLEQAASLVRRPIDTVRSVVGVITQAASDPGALAGEALGTVRSFFQVEPARSPLWSGHRSTGRRLETLTYELEDVKATAKRLGGTVNDLFVTAVAGGAGRYHARFGHDVEELRLAMPVNTRTDRSAGGNAFLPARLVVSCAVDDAEKRFAAIHDRLSQVKKTPTLGLVDALSGVVSQLPAPLIASVARTQTDTVDFAASNVRGAPFDLYIAGAHIEHNYPMGPTGGTAFMATTLTTAGRFDVGIVCDTAAIEDSAVLRDCLDESFQELLA